MASLVRDSKFRHCQVSISPRERHYEQLRVANVASDGNFLSANSLFFAYVDSSSGGKISNIFVMYPSLIEILKIKLRCCRCCTTTDICWEESHTSAGTNLPTTFNSCTWTTCAGTYYILCIQSDRTDF